MPAGLAYDRRMTFRDDHDAALARADALEIEVERLQRERDALAEERDRAVAARDEAASAAATATSRDDAGPGRTANAKAKAESKAAARARRRAAAKAKATAGPPRERRLPLWAKVALIVGATAAAGGFFGSAISEGCARQRAHDRWRAATAARAQHERRWRALIAVEPCVRKVAFDAVGAEHLTPERYDPRTQTFPGWSFEQLAGNCTGGAKALVADLTTAPAIRTELGDWLAIEAELAPVAKALGDYYRGRDWVEDDLRGARALWAQAHALIDRRRAAIATLRARTLPALREEIRGYQAAERAAHGEADGWWRVELGLALWALVDAGYDAGGIYAGRELDNAVAAVAVRDRASRLLGQAAAAPLALRRELRALDGLLAPLARGAVPGGEEPIWQLDYATRTIWARTDDAPPGQPPAPGPEPPHGD